MLCDKARLPTRSPIGSLRTEARQLAEVRVLVRLLEEPCFQRLYISVCEM
jgi:hypothetical protein